MDNTKRIPILDVVRGTCILLMIIYHSCYSIIAFGFFKNVIWLYKAFTFFNTPYYKILWLITLCGFFGVAGIVSNFSRSNIKRSFPVLIVALVISFITIIFIPEEAIYFGVLHCMGFSMLIYGLIEKYSKDIFHKIPILIFVLFFILFYFLTETIPPVERVSFSLFGNEIELPLFLFGFYYDNFFSADYYPLFPWIFLFFAGVRAGEKVKNGKLPKGFYQADVKFLSFVGRYPLIIYAIHVPVIVVIFFILDKFISN